MVCRRSDHNVLLLGPPGAGQSRLARRLTTILPAMTLAEALETTRLHRVAGLTGDRAVVVTTRPFRAPRRVLPGSLAQVLPPRLGGPAAPPRGGAHTQITPRAPSTSPRWARPAYASGRRHASPAVISPSPADGPTFRKSP